MAAKTGHALFVLFLFGYAALLIFQLLHGLASFDAHGIIRVVRASVEDHHLEVSRPPGHPTTEIYLFGAVGWVLQNAGRPFGETSYLVLQAVAAVLTMTVFYELLCRAGILSWRALLAVIALGFSAQFLANALDGEEFIFALLFLLLAIRLLLKRENAFVGWPRLSLAVCCLALATGCRPEIIFAAILFPVYCLLHSRLRWKEAGLTVLLLACATALLWLPLVRHGLHPPYDTQMGWKDSLLGAGYKMAFQAFTFPVFCLFGLVLLGAFKQIRASSPPSRDFLFHISWLLPLLFFALFFFYPTKPAYLLASVPFLLLLVAIMSGPLLVGLTVVTLLSAFVTIDIFRGRQLVPPFLVAGPYRQTIRQKPFGKLEYLRGLTAQCTARSVIVADAWPWDLDFERTHGAQLRRKEILSSAAGSETTAFYPGGNENCILLPREAALEKALLAQWEAKGYEVKMDAAVYRSFYAKYDVRSALAESVRIGETPVTLFQRP